MEVKENKGMMELANANSAIAEAMRERNATLAKQADLLEIEQFQRLFSSRLTDDDKEQREMCKKALKALRKRYFDKLNSK